MGTTPNNSTTPSEATCKEIGGVSAKGRCSPVVYNPSSIIWKIVRKPTKKTIINPIISFLTLFAMSHTFLIFPCPLTAIQFSILREERQVLSKYLTIECKPTDKRLKDLQFYIGCTIFDIDEILKNHNCHGYRCNSYILNKINLKLTYIFELVKLYDYEGHSITTHDFTNSYFRFSLILEHQFRLYTDMLR